MTMPGKRRLKDQPEMLQKSHFSWSLSSLKPLFLQQKKHAKVFIIFHLTMISSCLLCLPGNVFIYALPFQKIALSKVR